MKIRFFQSPVGDYEATCDSLEELSDKLILHNVNQKNVPTFGASIAGEKTVVFYSALRGYVVNPTK